MGPPHPAWQHKTAVFRHGGKKATEMLTQCVEKAPKWSFTGRPQDIEAQATPGPFAVNDKHKFTQNPTYSFGPPGGPDGDGRLHGMGNGNARGSSAPPGPGYVALGPTTPQYSFGTTKRGSPFPGVGNSTGPGPSAFHDPRHSKGPKFSMEARRSRSQVTDGPGPGCFVPRHPGGATYAPHWGKPRDDRPRPNSLSDGGQGPDFGGFLSSMPHGGPSFSFGARRDTEIGMHDGGLGKNATRDLGPVFTHFGYNDFGRASH